MKVLAVSSRMPPKTPTPNMGQYLLLAFAAVVLLAIIALNIDYRRRRARMTPEERAQQDKEIRDDSHW